MFSPKWKKEAHLLLKGARKFINYKRDLLADGQIGEIESRMEDLKQAIRAKDVAKVNETSKHLRAACENSLPREAPQGWFEENVEVMFVAIVIALGLRAFYLQPFRIPTGSMQPTLNGIIGTPIPENKWPAFPIRMWEKATRGRAYVKVVTSRDTQLPVVSGPGGYQTNIADNQYFHFFSSSLLQFADGSKQRMPGPANPVYEAGLQAALRKLTGGRFIDKPTLVNVPAGTVLCEGTIDSGDLVLVDKFSYHFRKPERGEVFVFNTLDIKGIEKRSGPQGAGSHYIKRLCGVPGDTLSVRSPDLLINGKIAQEPGIQRVIRGEGAYHINPDGYGFARPEGPHHGVLLPQSISKPDDQLVLAGRDARLGMREYAALGDNTGNSLDSRYWGTVKEFNLVGPALFSLWPVTTGHWGFIR